MIYRLKTILTPPRFLVAANMVCAALALVQGLVVARMLGASGYGVMAIFITLGGVAAASSPPESAENGRPCNQHRDAEH